MTPVTTSTPSRTLIELLDELRQRRVRLFLNDEGALRFQASKGAFTAELKAEVKERKAEIVEFLREARRAPSSEPAIEPVPRDQPLPLSFSQERLWFFDRFEPGSALYNLLNAVEMRGALDPDALAGALDDLVARHEALRTVFDAVDEQPVQRVLPRLSIELPIEDATSLDAARERAAELVALPFDLETGPLLRAALLRLGEARHVLVLVMHHIVSDGWSTGVMIRDLAALYRSRLGETTAGETPTLPPLDVHYPDYAAWQRRRLRGERLEAELDYWRSHLAGAPESLDLPLDRPRPAAQTTNGRTLRFAVDAERTAALDALAREHGASLFMVLLAAWNVLLSRLSGEDDVVVGTPIAGRNQNRTQNLIGFFVNTLALRTRLDGRPTFLEVLDRVRETTLAAYAHQDLPFEKIVEDLQPERDLSRNAIFQNMMVLQNAPQPSLDLGSLRLVPLLIEGETAQFDLTLTWVENEGRLDGEIEWNTDLFDAETIERWIGYQVRILEAVSQDPAARVDRLRLWSEAEERRVFHEWARGPELPGNAGDLLAHQVLARVAAERGDAPAVSDDTGARLTYAELDTLCDRLARHLLTVDPATSPAGATAHEARVAVCLPRILHWVTSLVAILRAGKVFVPLDPEAPASRQSMILEDSGARLVITTAERAEALGLDEEGEGGVRVVTVEEIEALEPIAEEKADEPWPIVDPLQAAYVIYTSGSTGRPKGVAVPHGALVCQIHGMIRAWRLGPEDRILELASYAFDVGQEQTFMALLSGGSLHIRGGDLWPPVELAARLDELGITAVDPPMVYWQQWVAEARRAEERGEDFAAPSRLRLVSVGGEAMSPEAARRWPTTPMGDSVLINAYGPTEATVTAVLHEVPRDFDRASVPIGSALSERVLRVLDRRGRPVPTGVAGELCIGDRHGGALLARGYVDRPKQTAEVFVPDPWSEVPGARLYRTGDQVRFLADGTIEFLGRVDEQVKIRGFRIEIGEIESALAAHPAVRELAVVVDESTAARGTGKRLVAYLVLHADSDGTKVEAPSTSELRAHLGERLPEYMVPSAFVVLDALPMTVSGKLDKRALPAPSWQSERFEAPTSATETRMAEIWADTLGVALDTLSVDANFFDLGGHSLLATQLVTRVGRAFDLDLPLRTLFETPTLRDLALAVDRLAADGAARALPPLERADRDAPLPLSHSQERLWLFEQLVPGTAIYNTSRAGRLLGPLDIDALERTFHELVRRHEALRTRYAAVAGGDPVQIVEPPRERPLEVVDLRPLPEEERRAEAFRRAQEEADTPFDLERSEPIRFRLLRLAEDEHVVLMSIHHVAYDLASGGILLHELETLYRAFAAGEPSPLPELALHYPDFAAWQRSWLDGDALDDQLDYWRRQLAPVADPAETPRLDFADRPRAGDESFAGALYRFTIPGDLGARAQAMARERSVTPFMLHLAAFYALLYRYAPQPRLLVGTAISNRSGAEMEDVVGFFDNLLPLLTAWSDDLDFYAALDRVRGVALGAYANQHVPFERLVREIRPERANRRVPLLQVVFLYLLDYPAMTREIAGLDMKPYELDVESAKFDLTLALRDTPDGLVGQIEYDTGLFDAATIERLARHYERLLGAALDAPDRPLVELPLLDEDELAEIDAWSRPEPLRKAPEAGLGVLERIVRRTAEAPDAIALAVEGGEPATRRELLARAEALAAALCRAGVGFEDRVVVCRGRDIGWIVALLAAWRAGAAYVPVDPAYPDERLRFVVEDTGAPLVLADPASAPRLAEVGVPVWIVDAEGVLDGSGTDDEARPGDLVHSPDPRSLAYTIYTSGSTGTPKGVEITHGSLARLVDWHLDRFALGTDDATSHLAGQGFDASAWEIWPALAAGARLEMPAERRRADPEALREWLAERAIDITFLPTPLAEALLAHDWTSERAPRAVLTGGDRLRRRPSKSTPFELVNNYGPTESTVVATSGIVPADADADADSPDPARGAPDIGRPIHGVRAHVLDRGLRPLPAGAPGELYLGGDQLARGYLRRPALTAERFVPDPFTEPGREPGREGARLYRTGDLVRWRRDGRLEFLGRLDEQVKIRGFRVELGEIEATLVRHAAITAAAVVAPAGPTGVRQLVAWIESSGDQPDLKLSDLPASLAESLAESLPAHMVPSRFEIVDALPVTANGKLDRRALERRARDLLAAESDEAVAPRTEIEAAVADLWAELLERPRPSIHDDFFALGGHSLLATRLIARVREDFGVDLAMEAVFDHPTVARFAEVVEVRRGLAPADGERADGEPGESIVSMELPRLDRDGLLPLSFAQERIVFLDRLRPGDPAYTLPATVRLRGPLDVDALRRAAEALVARHESLRSTFVEAPGEEAPFAVRVHPATEAAARTDFQVFESIEGKEGDDLDVALRRRLAEEVDRPFSLAEGPLLRLRLWRLGDEDPAEDPVEDHVFLWTVHHAVADGWSMGVFLRDLAALYAREIDPRSPSLPELAVGTVDFAAAQRQWLGSGAGERQLAYWRERLADVRPTALPTSRPPSADPAGALHRQALDADLSAAVRELASREGASLFMILAAALAGLFRAWGEDDHVTLGYPVAGRRRSELEGLIGMFLNTLVLRIDVADDPSPRERIARARRAVLEGDANQDVPFETLLEELRPERDLRRTPLFQVMLNMLSFPEPPARLGALALEPLPLEEDTAKFDLTLYASEERGRLKIDWVYRTARFEAARVEVMAEQLAEHLRQLAAPDQPIRELAALPAPTSRVEAGSVLRTILHRLAEHPERPAILQGQGQDQSQGDRTWTRGQVDARSAELARRLVSAGVGRGDVVAIHAVRDASLVPALLGVWRAGAAFALLDASYPAARLLAQRCRAAPAVVIRLEGAEPLPMEGETHAPPEIVFSADPAVPVPASEPAPDPAIDLAIDLGGRLPAADDLAYVAFTSGSTGEPRAIEGTHAPLDHFVAWHLETFDLGEDDRFALLSGLGHDPLLRDVLAPLAAGASLHVPPADSIRVPRALRAFLREAAVSVVHATPSLLRLLAEDRGGDDAPLDALRRVFTSGETLYARDVERLRGLAPAARCVNFYGATETPQGVAFHEVAVERVVDQAAESPDLPVPVGRGIDGVDLLVLDADGRPAPPLVRGEIVVRTPFLARGYRGDDGALSPEDTAERFVEIDGVRAYRTGDLGRVEPDGAVVFLGRADRQVKVRGFRVELADVERAIAEHPAVGEVVVRPRASEGETAGLAAWWVPADLSEEPGVEEPSAEALRAHAAARLPDYAVPTAFVRLDALPLTPNGKVDERALPDPARAQRGDVEKRAPESATEIALAGLWRDLLGVDEVGLDDHFFALGGHSLAATRLASRIFTTFGVECPLAAFFEAPTLGALADQLEALLDEASGPSTSAVSAASAPQPTAEPRSPDEPRPLSFAQERLVFLDRFQGQSTAFVLAVGLDWRGDFRPEALRRALDALVERHEILRTRFVEVDGVPVARVDEDARIVPEPADLEALEIRPIPLDRAPLARLRVETRAEDHHRLLLEMHHVLSDGWSMALVVGELGELYAAAVEERAPRLPALSIQYADFAAWQRRALTGERLDAELAGWRERLDGLPPRLDLPTDRPRPRVLGERGERLAFALDEALVTRLQERALEHGTTLFTPIAAALQALLARWSGQRDFALGLPVAGRRFESTESLVGLFVNTLVLRADLRAAESWSELLQHVHGSVLDVQTHPDLPFEKLVAELQPERSLGHAPFFQVMLAFQNVPRRGVDVPGARIEWLDPEHAATPLDLHVELSEDAGRLEGSFVYNAELFEAPSVRRMIAGFRHLLEALAEDPSSRWLDAPLLDESALAEERTAARSRTLIDPPLDPTQPLGAAIFRVAHEDGERVAITGSDTEWTYAELARRALAVSAELRRRGLAPEERVGVCSGRGPEMIAALLGILHAGGVYLPLDPSYPASRLAYMLDDACGSERRRLVLTRVADRASRPALGTETVEPEWIEVESLRDPDPVDLDALDFPAIDPDRLAYTIYTSGSTGRPKGVLVSHGAAMNFLASMAEEPGLDESDVLAAVTTLSFDISVLEIFLPLTLGARVALLDREIVTDGVALARRLDEESVSVLQATPALWRLLLDAGWNGAPGLRALCGGEALPPDLADALVERCAELWNLYGPTETTVWSSARRVEAAERPVRLGGPIAHTTLHVLDDRLRPVPRGVAGEIYLGGRGLARGYHGRAALTAERFVPDPFAEAPGARLYRVGDLARRLDDGTLEFLGRTDHQVKVRGYRVEPGEVEAVLSKVPGVSRAAVVARGDQLVAYLVGEPEASLDPAQDVARRELPAHMVPDRWIVLDELPLTPSGKVDRRALPDPNDGSWDRAAPGEPPRDQLEQRLAALWREILEVETVSRDDDFFALGGHSLLAMRLVAAIARETGRTLPVQALFLAPTLAGLADRLRAPGESTSHEILVPLSPSAERLENVPPLFCVHGVAGGVSNYAGLARALADQREVLGVQPPENLAAIDSLEDLAALYRAEIRRRQPTGALHLLGWSMGGVVAFEIARQEEATGGSVETLVLVDSSLPRVARVDEREILLAFAADLGPSLGLDPRALADLGEPASPGEAEIDSREIFRRLEATGALPSPLLEKQSIEDLHRLYERYRERFRENWRLLAAYEPGRARTAAVVYRAEDGALDPAEASPDWRDHLVEPSLRSVPGNHFRVLGGEALEILVRRLRQ